MPAPIDVFISFVHEDDTLRSELERHLSALTQIRAWSSRHVEAGRDPGEAVEARLKVAQVILLLVSADYLASEMVPQAELMPALAQHERREARVIPVIVRACEWSQAPFARLMPLPSGGKAVTAWPRHDDAWADVARGLLEVIGQIASTRAKTSKLTPAYQNEKIRTLSERLEAARERRGVLKEAERSTAEVDQEILALRRQFREGGQLRAGDALGDGRYLLLDRIGRGGFAIVWRALDRERNEEVAIKVLHSELAEDTIRRERFIRGARIMAELEHPAVVRVLEAHGEDGGYHFFVMELVPGGDLRRAVLEQRIVGEAVLPIVLQVGEALAKAHAKKLVHRDVKPANILLDEAGAPRLTDFDLVGGTDTTGGTRTGAMGTVVYAAPELLHKPQEADARADVYGLGMTAVFGLYGEDLSLDVVRDADGLIAEQLSCQPAIKAVLMQAVAWRTSKRFADAAAFCKALREVMELAPVEPPALDAPTPRRPNPAPHPALPPRNVNVGFRCARGL